jgi:hypothetical protein
MEKQFKAIAGEDGTIDLSEFKRALKVKDVSLISSAALLYQKYRVDLTAFI